MKTYSIHTKTRTYSSKHPFRTVASKRFRLNHLGETVEIRLDSPGSMLGEAIASYYVG